MERTSQVKQEVNNKNCSFCFPSTSQIKAILRITYLQLRKIFKQRRYSDLPLSNQQNNGAISRFVRVVFDQHQFELKMSKGCLHYRLRNMLRDRLKCRNDQFEVVLEELCDRIARRNYELQIISSQIKNVQVSVVEIDQLQQVPFTDSKQSESAMIFREESKIEKKEQNNEGEAEVKVEEVVQPVVKSSEGSPSTIIPIMSTTTFGEMPYAYNFLFYGNYYH